MEKQSDGDQSEQFSESFICCVCLDLLYKPIVLACGHVSCFWCVHRSMNNQHESRCPICRHRYRHFPTICLMLHFLLLKMYPVAYKRRENQILGEEKELGVFSPNVGDLLCALHAKKESKVLDVQAQSSTSSSNGEQLSTNLSFIRKTEPCANMEQPEFIALVQDNSPTIPQQITAESFESSRIDDVKVNNLSQRSSSKICQHVSIVDVLCALCKQLLFRPAALNCGHVYCETCIIPADEVIKCQVCQSLHPSSFPKVCLELNNFLKEQFPEEYNARRGTVQLKQVNFQDESPPTCSTKKESLFNWWGGRGLKPHIGVGCDSCGMFPIIGDRYRCKDCKEAIGFDLCGDCYNTRSKLPGRFNQQHTSDHKLVLLKSPLQNIMLKLLNRQLEDGSPASYLSNETSENTLPFLMQSDNAQENTEHDMLAPSTSSDTEESQNDDAPPPPP
ncbi:E3 ubiquitin-protein ligase PRT1-like isoform X1 [Actinidia eriantha]|uniref:E3 ubiquitin-protein ligase PRT1-like isoform X1 n=3 Tax=Actinidia eriantha TaxID=165200 RepID=UPI00258CB3F2|nr:E3 ubiquitin-protein ligase PRT1-like isoform X1 [Actinidia eriantha]